MPKLNQKTGAGDVTSSTLFCDAFKYHDEQARCRMKHATETRMNIAAMDANPDLRPNFECDWENTKTYNLAQADHDEKWATRHAGFATEIMLAKEVIAAARELCTAVMIYRAGDPSEDDHWRVGMATAELHGALIALDSQNAKLTHGSLEAAGGKTEGKI